MLNGGLGNDRARSDNDSSAVLDIVKRRIRQSGRPLARPSCERRLKGCTQYLASNEDGIHYDSNLRRDTRYLLPASPVDHH